MSPGGESEKSRSKICFLVNIIVATDTYHDRG